MQPDEFLVFARGCIVGNPSEAAIRSGISRAYLAAYLATRDHIDSRGIPQMRNPRSGSHGIVLNTMVSIPHPDCVTHQSRLENLKYLREQADYELQNTRVLRRAAKAIALSQRIVNWLNNLP